MPKKNWYVFALLLVLMMMAMAAPALAADPEKTPFHEFYEKTAGPVGSLLGIVSMIIFWQLAGRAEPNFKLTLRFFAGVMLLVNLASIAFAFHGMGMLGPEETRYVERILRLAAQIFSDVAAVILFLRMTRKSKA